MEKQSSMIDNSMVLKRLFLVLTLLITLGFGLYPKDFGREHVPVVNSAGDLSFTKYSVATSPIPVLPTLQDNEQTDELRLDVRLHIPQMPTLSSQFSIIFSVNDTQGNSQILLGQWENYLIVMSGDDYSNKTGQPRITIALDSVEGYVYPQPVQVQIQASATQTNVTVNQQPMAQSTDFIMSLEPSELTVSLGNTLDRKQGWPGTLMDFELGLVHCTPEDSGSKDAPCSTVYSIDLQDVASAWTLEPAFSVLKTEWLSTASLKYWKTPAFYRDVVINLLGFVPVTLAIFFVAVARYPLSSSVLITIAITVLISLLIESAQIFLPSRTSSIVDLLVNSSAGVFTTLLCYVGVRVRDSRLRGNNEVPLD